MNKFLSNLVELQFSLDPALYIFNEVFLHSVSQKYEKAQIVTMAHCFTTFKTKLKIHLFHIHLC